MKLRQHTHDRGPASPVDNTVEKPKDVHALFRLGAHSTSLFLEGTNFLSKMTSQAANGSLPDATTQLEKPCVPCCAYCYVTITTLIAMGEKLDKCGKCQKRKFCSRDCQVLDWKAGHKHFCGISGEANVDWEVKECGGEKGFGIFALRDIGKDENSL